MSNAATPTPSAPAPDPEGAAAVKRVAETRDPSNGAKANALAYFMGEAPPPGRDTRFPLWVDFGELGEPNWQQCTFRPLAQEELVKCEEMATHRNDDGVIDRIDPFTRWSYIFAYSCIEPHLGEALAARRANGGEDAKLPDTAALVREVFRWQSGVLQKVVYKIEERSRMGQDSEQAVREVEAGKDSS